MRLDHLPDRPSDPLPPARRVGTGTPVQLAARLDRALTRQLRRPSLNGSTRVDKGGAPQTIGKRVGTYNVKTGKLTKRFTIDVTEVDKGTLGQDDQGQGTLTFDLTPNMKPSTKAASIRLKRPNMSYKGKVKVTMTAQRA